MASVTKRKWTHKGEQKEAWIVRYKDGLGAHRQSTFARKKEADAFRSKVEVDLRSGDHIAPGQSKTVENATKLLLEHVDAQVTIGAMRPCTARNYHSAFRQAILPFIGHKLVLDVRPEDLEAWYHKVVREKRMTPVSAYRRLWFVQRMFQFAVRRRWCNSNPADAAIANLGRPREQTIETFDLESVRRIIAAADVKPHKGRHRPFEMTRLAVHLGAFCGLRWGEIFGLTLDHVDLEGKTLRIRHSLDGMRNLQEPKTKAGVRNVPIPDHLAEQLAAYIAKWPINNDRRLLFTADNGSAMIATNFRAGWLALQSRAGVADKEGRNLHFHALRHFACSWMIENGWPITDVSSILGHANVTITLQVYAHSLKSRAKSVEAMQDLAKKLLMEGAKPAPLALEHVATVSHEQEYAEFSVA